MQAMFLGSGRSRGRVLRRNGGGSRGSWGVLSALCEAGCPLTLSLGRGGPSAKPRRWSPKLWTTTQLGRRDSRRQGCVALKSTAAQRSPRPDAPTRERRTGAADAQICLYKVQTHAVGHRLVMDLDVDMDTHASTTSAYTANHTPTINPQPSAFTAVNSPAPANIHSNNPPPAPWLPVPSRAISVVEHPCIVKHVDKAIVSLGGPVKLSKVRGPPLEDGPHHEQVTTPLTAT